jgi:hypothetical protein
MKNVSSKLLYCSCFVYEVVYSLKQTEVSGVVSDNLGLTPGVSITVKGTTKVSLHSVDGKYDLQVSSANDVLVSPILVMNPRPKSLEISL